MIFSRLFCLFILSWIIMPIYGQQWMAAELASSDYGLPFFNSQRTIPSYQVYSLQTMSLRHSGHTQLTLPTPEGEWVTVEIEEDPIFTPALQQQFPHIKSFQIIGENIQGRISWTNRMLDGLFLYRDQWVVIEPLINGKHLVYYEKDAQISSLESTTALGQCLTPDLTLETKEKTNIQPQIRRAEPAETKIYDLAISTTSTYAQRYGGTVNGVLTQVNLVFNRVNQVFQREMGLKFRIIENVPQLIYLTKESDPYFEGNNNAMLNKAGELFNSIVGTSNYDIGHLLATNCGGGTAGVSSGTGTVCTSVKGQALSCDLTQNVSDYVRVLTHELGHQLGAAHTWSNCPGINDVQRSNGSAVEPGSGSTIMSYISSCGPENLSVIEAPLYFHAQSIEEMNAYIGQGNGANCVSLVTSTNQNPEITVMPQENLVIPIKTPFFLKGKAVDAEGATLLYTWEQMDIGPISPLGAPIQTAPMFRSLPPDTASIRYFPSLQTLIDNEDSPEEVLPTYTRDLNFRLTVRDNATETGGLAYQDVKIKSTSGAGPFLVNFPNSSEDQLFAGSLAMVEWSVANTNLAPIGVSHVTIAMSTDGGLTYPMVLLEETENDGQAEVQLPNIVSDQVRFRITARDHIFFDISDENLSIQLPSEPTYGLNISVSDRIVCLPEQPKIKVESFPVLGFSDSIEYELVNNYDGIAASLTKTKIPVGERLEIDLSVAENFDTDTLFFPLISKADQLDTIRRTIQVIVYNNNFADIQPVFPMLNDAEIELSPDFEWNTSANADYYTLEVSTSASFSASDMVFQESNISGGQFVTSPILDGSSIYYWRIRSHNICGVDENPPVYAFQTAGFDCHSFTSADLPKGIGGSSPGSVSSTISVSDQFIIADVNVQRVKGYHESVDQIKLSISKGEEIVYLYNGDCGVRTFDFDISFDDDVIQSTDCRLNVPATVRPLERLSNFYGKQAQGDWIFTLADTVIGAGGLLNQWMLELCGSIPTPLLSVSTDSLRVAPMGQSNLTSKEVIISDYNQLIFELVALPSLGEIRLNNQVLVPGMQWTGNDLLNGRLQYVSNQDGAGKDGFAISIKNQDNAWSGIIDVPVVIDPRTSYQKFPQSQSIKVSPNPFKGQTFVENRGHIDWSNYKVYDIHGKLILDQPLSIGTQQFNVASHNWLPGMYILVIETKDRQLHTMKIIAQ